jgi:hypothetical protein
LNTYNKQRRRKEGQQEFHPTLVGIGKEIVEKCKQIPLAVIKITWGLNFMVKVMKKRGNR